MSPTQAKPKNKWHASPAFGILVEKDAEVRADFGDGFEKPGQQSREHWEHPMGSTGKTGDAQEGQGWEGDTRLKKDKQSIQVKGRRDLN